VILCLQITHGLTGMVRDVRSRLRCVRLRPLLFGVVATGTSYREVYRPQRFIESHRPGACSAMISGSAETSTMEPP